MNPLLIVPLRLLIGPAKLRCAHWLATAGLAVFMPAAGAQDAPSTLRQPPSQSTFRDYPPGPPGPTEGPVDPVSAELNYQRNLQNLLARIRSMRAEEGLAQLEREIENRRMAEYYQLQAAARASYESASPQPNLSDLLSERIRILEAELAQLRNSSAPPVVLQGFGGGEAPVFGDPPPALLFNSFMTPGWLPVGDGSFGYDAPWRQPRGPHGLPAHHAGVHDGRPRNFGPGGPHGVGHPAGGVRAPGAHGHPLPGGLGRAPAPNRQPPHVPQGRAMNQRPAVTGHPMVAHAAPHNAARPAARPAAHAAAPRPAARPVAHAAAPRPAVHHATQAHARPHATGGRGHR